MRKRGEKKGQAECIVSKRNSIAALNTFTFLLHMLINSSTETNLN
jgi:hypothetical protein